MAKVKKLKGYQGIFFTKEVEEELVSLQGEQLENITKDKHVTFKFGDTEKYSDELIGVDIPVKLVGYACDGKNSGFQVLLPKELEAYYKNKNRPHVTVSLSNEGKAIDTGLLAFEPIDEIEIVGRLGYFIYGKGVCLTNEVFQS